MMKVILRRIWPYLVVGNSLFFYLILYFPKEGETLLLSKIAIDVIKSILMSLSIILGFLIMVYLDEKWIKKGKDSANNA